MVINKILTTIPGRLLRAFHASKNEHSWYFPSFIDKKKVIVFLVQFIASQKDTNIALR